MCMAQLRVWSNVYIACFSASLYDSMLCNTSYLDYIRRKFDVTMDANMAQLIIDRVKRQSYGLLD